LEPIKPRFWDGFARAVYPARPAAVPHLSTGDADVRRQIGPTNVCNSIDYVEEVLTVTRDAAKAGQRAVKNMPARSHEFARARRAGDGVVG